MARANVPIVTFNRGRISKLALARTDLDRTRLSAEVQTNFVPRTLGSMMVRPGLGYIGGIRNDDPCRMIPFIRSATDRALLEISSSVGSTTSTFRAWVDENIVERVNSTATITNGDFSSSALTGWTDADESGATSEWRSGNLLGLTGTRYARAKRRQSITSSSGDHGIAVSIRRGEPILRIGSSTGGDDYFSETTLRPGNYSLKITSTGNFFIEFSAHTEYRSLVESISVESSGDLTITCPWQQADLSDLRWKQSQDVIFVGARNYPQRRIERYGAESWSVVQYYARQGPFRTINITQTQLNPTALTGVITIEADRPVFQPNQAESIDFSGALIEITSIGQQVEGTFTAENQFTDPIRVTSVADGRKFTILDSSHTSSDITVRVQRSIGEEGNYANVSGLAFTSTIDSTHDDGLDNQIAFYRVGVPTGDFGGTSTDQATASLTYASGGITGRAFITQYDGATSVQASVLRAFGSTSPSELWSEGDWSIHRGWPTSVALHEGRLMWAGKGKLWGSVSDGFESFNAEVEGDSGPINLNIGEGSNDVVEWLGSINRLILGTDAQELQAKTSSLEEPLTPTNFALRDIETQGSAGIQAAKIGKRLYFVQAGGTRVYEIAPTQNSLDYEPIDLTIAVPEIGEPSISRLAVQRQPDTRLHCVRSTSTGTVAMLVRDPAENVLAWIDVETDGIVEESAVLPAAPGDVEDAVYYVVNREIDGSTKRFLEKWARESEARGDSTNKMMDAFVQFNTTSTTIVSGADHLVGSSVVCWANGKDLGSYTVSSTGTFTASQASTTFYYGLPYSALFKSVKLAYADRQGTALTQKKKVDHLGIIAADIHAQGLKYGPSTSTLDPLPVMKEGAPISSDTVHSAFDTDPFEFPGSWNTDSRFVLFGQAPRPATVLGAIISMETKSG